MNISRNQIVTGIVMLIVGLIAGAAIASAVNGGMNSAAEQAADVAKIQEVWNEYAAASDARDFERWLALWVDDGLRMAPSDFGARQVGKEQIRAVMQPAFDLFDQTGSINSLEIQVMGEWAYSHGAFEIMTTPKGGGDTMVQTGQFLTILVKQDDGSWKIAIDCFNF